MEKYLAVLTGFVRSVTLGTAFALSAGIAAAADVDGTWSSGAFLLPRELAKELHTPASSIARIDKFQPELQSAQTSRKYPLAIVMHGCMGITSENGASARLLAGRGFVVFLPSYYGRAGVAPRCGGSAAGVPYFANLDDAYLKDRTEEFANAVEEARKLSFVDATRLLAFGHSMGGATVAQLGRSDVTAAIITGWNCVSPYTKQSPSSVPQLSMRFEDDPWLKSGWYCGAKMLSGRDEANTLNVVLQGQKSHEVMQSQEAQKAIAAFLNKYLPEEK